ncbi:MAG: isoprenylcysteine carboxylmethyltransferase family protein [Candidatus Eisenbacteria bacterium]
MTTATNPRRHPMVSAIAALVVLALETTLLTFAMGGWSALRAWPPALALLGVWGVSGIALAVLRPIGRQQVVRIERDAFVMVALLVLPYSIPFVSAAGRTLPSARLDLALAEPLAWLGVAAAALGLGLRVASMRQLGARFSPLVAVQREHALETTGWYSRVRHPGYLGALLASLGAALAFGTWVALPLWALMVLAQWARVRREESLLAGHFGDVWRSYVARTGAMLPRLGGTRD